MNWSYKHCMQELFYCILYMYLSSTYFIYNMQGELTRMYSGCKSSMTNSGFTIINIKYIMKKKTKFKNLYTLYKSVRIHNALIDNGRWLKTIMFCDNYR